MTISSYLGWRRHPLLRTPSPFPLYPPPPHGVTGCGTKSATQPVLWPMFGNGSNIMLGCVWKFCVPALSRWLVVAWTGPSLKQEKLLAVDVNHYTFRGQGLHLESVFGCRCHWPVFETSPVDLVLFCVPPTLCYVVSRRPCGCRSESLVRLYVSRPRPHP